MLEWWARPCGFIFTPDSYQFISASRSFRESGIFSNADGSRFTNWPPLFPLILSAFKNPQQAMVWITILCKVIFGVVVFYVARLFLTKKSVAVFYLMAVLLSVHLLMVSVFMWSEMLFITLMYLNIYFALSVRNNPRNYYFMILTGFLFCMQRHVGMLWIAGTSLWFLFEHDLSWKSKLVKSLSYFILCTSGLWCWNLYNTFFVAEKSIFEDRNYFYDTFLNVQSILNELGQSILPLRGWWAIFAGGLLVIALIYFILKNFQADSNVRLLALGLLIYTIGFIPVSYIATDVDRYYAVVMPIVVLFCFMLIEDVVIRHPKILTITLICLALWTIYPVARTGKNALLWRRMSCSGVYVK